jgi:hypothetical protein
LKEDGEMSNSAAQVRRRAETYGRGAQTYAAVLEPTLEPMAHHMIELASIAESASHFQVSNTVSFCW